MRGRIERDPTGTVAQGCGIAIDRTEENAACVQTEQVMNRMAEHVIALRGLAQTLQRPMLMIERVERLMIEVRIRTRRFLPDPRTIPSLRPYRDD